MFCHLPFYPFLAICSCLVERIEDHRRGQDHLSKGTVQSRSGTLPIKWQGCALSPTKVAVNTSEYLASSSERPCSARKTHCSASQPITYLKVGCKRQRVVREGGASCKEPRLLIRASGMETTPRRPRVLSADNTYRRYLLYDLSYLPR